MMKPETKAEWVKALRSGDYTQTTSTLRDDKGFCCLGVLLDVSKMGSWEDSIYEYENDEGESRNAEGDLCSLRNAFAISSAAESKLVEMNDGNMATGVRKHSFAEIADYIEANL